MARIFSLGRRTIGSRPSALGRSRRAVIGMIEREERLGTYIIMIKKKKRRGGERK